jgi:hypothetical protein
MKMFSRLRSTLWVICSLIFVTALTACGGGTPPSPTTTATIPSISSQPSSQSIYSTQTATFSVSATSSSTISYQWRKNSSNITGATSSSYTTPATTVADDGIIYSVVVTNSTGSVTSNNAMLTVTNAAPVITTQPTNQSVQAGLSASFSVTATGMPNMSYQWRKNGTNISGATSGGYTTPATTVADNGAIYSVVVTNGVGVATSNNAALTVTSANIGYLLISEVSTCFYFDVGCWFEIYNPTASTINLSSYSLRSGAIDTAIGGPIGTQTFTFPSFNVPAGGYVVVSGNGSANNVVQRGTQQLWLRSGNMVPFWSSNGFIELMSAGATVDFVKFGTSTDTPTTSSGWSGSAVAALPYSSSGYNQSIVRSHTSIATTDTNTSADWTAVAWATPGGRNDVPAGAVDADNDGIPDSAEVFGGTFAGLDLYAMGARTSRQDLFIEVDYMNSTDPGVIPRSESLQMVVNSFAAQGISVHFDAGTQLSSTFSVANFNLGQGSNVVPYEPCVMFDRTTCSLNSSTRRSVWDWKDDNFDIRRRPIFHYALYGNSQLASGASGSSGRAELPGNDMIMTMGNWGFTTGTTTSLNTLINMQASTFMHELGHNLNLRHGGSDHVNYKPNYWSVMNYAYQLQGLDADPTSQTAYLRWRYAKGDGKTNLAGTSTGYCSLPNSACGSSSQFIMSYSNGSGSSLNEGGLFEAANVGRGTAAGAYADWDLSNGLTGGSVVRDLNGDGLFTTYSDYNDWGNLLLAFGRNYTGNAGVNKPLNNNLQVTRKVLNTITADQQQPVSEEEAPPQHVLDAIRRTR